MKYESFSLMNLFRIYKGALFHPTGNVLHMWLPESERSWLETLHSTLDACNAVSVLYFLVTEKIKLTVFHVLEIKLAKFSMKKRTNQNECNVLLRGPPVFYNYFKKPYLYHRFKLCYKLLHLCYLLSIKINLYFRN